MNSSQSLRLACVATLGLMVLAALPAAALPDPTASPGAVIRWWDATGPGAAVALIRLAAMAGCLYVAAIATLYALADSLRLPALGRLALLAASPGFRRHLAAGALTLAVVTTPAAANGQTANDDSVIVLADVGPELSGQAADVDREAILLTDAGPAVAEPTGRHVTPPGPHAGGFGRYEVAAAPDAWVVEAGDHLWAIAERMLEAAGEPTDDATVTAYWTRLIDANIAVLDGDPDLIHVGQVITLPPMDQG